MRSAVCVTCHVTNYAFASGSLPAPAVGTRAPSSELGDVLGIGAGPGTTAPRMSNAMARSLGLVPPKETRTRTLGKTIYIVRDLTGCLHAIAQCVAVHVGRESCSETRDPFHCDCVGADSNPCSAVCQLTVTGQMSKGCTLSTNLSAAHAGALADLMQGPRATSLADGLNRPQMSYSLPAQLPDPDQHMHEVYLAAQAAAAAAGHSQVLIPS